MSNSHQQSIFPHRDLTKSEKLYHVLSDHEWHTTRNLVRQVGHNFAHAKYQLTGYGYLIEKRRHPFKRHQFQYRLKS